MVHTPGLAERQPSAGASEYLLSMARTWEPAPWHVEVMGSNGFASSNVFGRTYRMRWQPHPRSSSGAGVYWSYLMPMPFWGRDQPASSQIQEGKNGDATSCLHHWSRW
jgi:hypothetical protein